MSDASQDDRPPTVAERIDQALDEFCERAGQHEIFLVSVVLLRGRNPPGPGYPRLRLELECDPRQGEEVGKAMGAAFARELEQRFPGYGGPHEVTVRPGVQERDAALSEQIKRVEAIAHGVLARHRGLYLADIELLPGWGVEQRFEVLVVRDDVDDADDETAAANEVRQAIEQADPDLARLVGVRGDYCK